MHPTVGSQRYKERIWIVRQRKRTQNETICTRWHYHYKLGYNSIHGPGKAEWVLDLWYYQIDLKHKAGRVSGLDCHLLVAEGFGVSVQESYYIRTFNNRILLVKRLKPGY